MLYNIANWLLLIGGRGLYKGHVGELTAKTYPPSGWDYIDEFRRRTFPVRIIVGDHDFLDFGIGILKKWTQGVARIKLTTIEKAGHLLWLDQPDALAAELLRRLEAPGSEAR